MSEEFVATEQAPSSGGGETFSSGEVPSTPAVGGTQGGSPQITSVGNDLYEVKVNGKTLKVGLDELRNGYSRQQDYTRKAQELAARERDWTARLGHYEKAIQETRALLSDRAKLAQILQGMPAGEDSSEGDELLTRSQVDAMRAKWFEEYEARQEQKIAAQRYQAEVEGLKQTYMGQLREVYDSMGEQFPALKKLPLFNEIRMKVGSYEPQSIEDAKALFADEIRALAKDQGWVNGATTVMNGSAPSGIEPPGGAGIMPAEGERFSSVRDPKLKSAVLQDIEQMMRASLNS